MSWFYCGMMAAPVLNHLERGRALDGKGGASIYFAISCIHPFSATPMLPLYEEEKGIPLNDSNPGVQGLKGRQHSWEGSSSLQQIASELVGLNEG